MSYQQVNYGGGFAVTVNPPERSEDVMHYLITGHLLGGRSLDGVTWSDVENKEYSNICKRRAEELAKSMEAVK